MAERRDEQTPSLPPASDYWSQSRRPLAALFFAAPLLAVYEAGLVCLGPHAMRNGADAWLRQTLDLLGFNAYFLLPALVVSVLLAWHHVLRQPWYVPRAVLCGMAGECLSLAATLWFFWSLYRFLLQAAVQAVGLNVAGRTGKIVCYLGAGIYEELLFRLDLVEPGDRPAGVDAGRPRRQRRRRDRPDEPAFLGRALRRLVGRHVPMADILVPLPGRSVLRRAVPLQGLWDCRRDARILRRARRLDDYLSGRALPACEERRN